jgi:hypothetical protein
MNKLGIALLILGTALSFSNIVWFDTSEEGETAANITGRTNTGEHVNTLITLYNGKDTDLQPGTYYIHTRHPDIKQGFSPVRRQYIVTAHNNDPQHPDTHQVVETVILPVATTMFKVTQTEQHVSVTIPMNVKKVEEGAE